MPQVGITEDLGSPVKTCILQNPDQLPYPTAESTIFNQGHNETLLASPVEEKKWWQTLLPFKAQQRRMDPIFKKTAQVLEQTYCWEETAARQILVL